MTPIHPSQRTNLTHQKLSTNLNHMWSNIATTSFYLSIRGTDYNRLAGARLQSGSQFYLHVHIEERMKLVGEAHICTAWTENGGYRGRCISIFFRNQAQDHIVVTHVTILDQFYATHYPYMFRYVEDLPITLRGLHLYSKCVRDNPEVLPMTGDA